MKLLAYTSPARGHLNPMMGPLLELRRRGAEVHVRTLAAEVESVRAAGLEAEPLAPAIEAIAHDDHEAARRSTSGAAPSPPSAPRAEHEVARPRSGARRGPPRRRRWSTRPPSAPRRWPSGAACAGPSPAPRCSKNRAAGGAAVRARAAAAGRAARPRSATAPSASLAAGFDRRSRLPARQRRPRRRRPAAARQRRRVPPPGAADALLHRRARSTTRGRCRRACAWSAPSLWDPPGATPVELPAGDRPLVLVACSSEFQDDGAIAAAALAGLRDRYRLVVTTAGVDPATSATPATRSSPASSPTPPILREADVVVCHGGMGITQKALAFGVPVCVVPWGRDQLDVAAHVVAAGRPGPASAAAASPPPASPPRSSEALACRARRGSGCKAGFEATGGVATAADRLEALASDRSSGLRSRLPG